MQMEWTKLAAGDNSKGNSFFEKYRPRFFAVVFAKVPWDRTVI